MFRYVEFKITQGEVPGRRVGQAPRYWASVICERVGEHTHELLDIDRILRDPVNQDLLAGITGAQITYQQKAEIGQVLGRCLLPERARELFLEAYETLGADEALRLRLRCEDDTLSQLPWEFARIGELSDQPRIAVNPKLSLVRHEVLASGQAVQPKQGEFVIVSVDCSEVGNWPDLVPDIPVLPDEYGGRKVKHIRVDPPTEDNLRAAVQNQRVDVFHFSGHGRRATSVSPACVVFQGPTNGRSGRARSHDVPGELLWDILRETEVSLIVLSACHSAARTTSTGGLGVAQALVKGGVPIVVAMQHEVVNSHAALFTAKFYESIFAGTTVDEAVSAGRISIVNHELPDYGRPVLYHRATDGPFITFDRKELERTRETEPEAGQPKAVSCAQVSGSEHSWRFEPGTTGPYLRPLNEMGELLSPDENSGRQLVASPDGRAVVSMSSGKISVAWFNRFEPSLDHWNVSFAVPAECAQASLLAASTAGSDEVLVVTSDGRRTSAVRLSQRYPPEVRVITEEPSRAALTVGSSIYTVDTEGRIREDELKSRLARMTKIDMLDAASSSSGWLLAALGRVEGARKLAVVSSGPDAPHSKVGTESFELEEVPENTNGLMVVRRLGRTEKPNTVVTAEGTKPTVHRVSP